MIQMEHVYNVTVSCINRAYAWWSSSSLGVCIYHAYTHTQSKY